MNKIKIDVILEMCFKLVKTTAMYNIPLEFRVFHDNNDLITIRYKEFLLYILIECDDCSALTTNYVKNNVLKFNWNYYVQYNSELYSISTKDLEDTDVLFNLSLLLDTDVYNALLVAHSVSSYTDTDFVIVTDTIKKYNESA